MATLSLDIVTPENALPSKDVHMAVIPGQDGDFGVLSGHVNLISSIRPGVINIYDGKENITEKVFVTGGFAEVTGERCTILATEAFNLADITKKEANDRLKTAKEKLEDTKGEKEKEIAAKNVSVLELLVESCE